MMMIVEILASFIRCSWQSLCVPSPTFMSIRFKIFFSALTFFSMLKRVEWPVPFRPASNTVHVHSRFSVIFRTSCNNKTLSQLFRLLLFLWKCFINHRQQDILGLFVWFVAAHLELGPRAQQQLVLEIALLLCLSVHIVACLLAQ